LITQAQFEEAMGDLNELVEKYGAESAMYGLTTVATVFAALLDVYAMPNPDNPQGMCEDKAAFRAHFARILTRAGETQRPIETKAALKRRCAAKRPTHEERLAILKDLLSLADVDADLETSRTWSAAECGEAEKWAAAVHLAASDNGNGVPEMPAVVKVLYR
jgi:hypothetical protein